MQFNVSLLLSLALVCTTALAEEAITPARPTAEDLIARAAKVAVAPLPGEGWHPLSNGSNLVPWHVTDFAGHGEVDVKNGLLILNMGGPFTGVGITNPPFQSNYEIALDAMRVGGSDFFCGMTVPVGTNFCSLIVGGWGGGVRRRGRPGGHQLREARAARRSGRLVAATWRSAPAARAALRPAEST